MISKTEDFIRPFLVTEGSDIVSFMKLSEEEKVNYSKDIVAKIVKSIEDKNYELDNVMINKSKGKIRDVENYSYIKNSLDLLVYMQNSMNEKIPYLDICLSAHQNLIDNEENFNKGYRLNKLIVQILYSDLVLALIQSVSFLIATCVDYIKDPYGNYQANVKYNINKNNKYPTVNLECLDKFNTMSKNGDLALFFTKIYTDKNLQEDVTDVFEDALLAGISLVGTIGKVLKAIVSFIPSIPEILRLMVSAFYFSRVKTSDYLRLQSYYIELNVERMRNLENPNKKSIQKQEKIMKDLVKLADKIDIDQKVSSKNAKTEIERENKNISESLKKKSSMNPTSNGSIEEIIL